jgi:hypothetical protein
MVIYLDTVLWNRLSEQQVDGGRLVETLAQDRMRGSGSVRASHIGE